MDGETFITKEGLIKFKKELDELKTIKRREIARRIEEAKELGDLSENAEYAEAKNEQAFVEGRVVELENLLKNATVIKNSGKSTVARVGSKIKILADNREAIYEIVGSKEANPEQGKISNESPMGQAFLGRQVGEVVSIDVPKGKMQFKIIGIQ